MMGGVLDGFPSGFDLNLSEIDRFLSYRRPGQSEWVSPRQESDNVTFLSGIDDKARTLGSPIAFTIPNLDTRPKDYEIGESAPFRPSHADYTYFKKYGAMDTTGGGRASARETVARCVAGAMAMQFLHSLGVRIYAFVQSIGNASLESDYTLYNLENIYNYSSRCPDDKVHEQILHLLQECKMHRDSVGGIVRCVATGVPEGWGSPIYEKLSSSLSSAMMSINAVKGFELGDGFEISRKLGSQVNDQMRVTDGKVHFLSNHSGGIQGGISNGNDIFFNVAFKPTPTIGQTQKTVTRSLENVSWQAQGRHDPTVVIRAVPVVQSMAALTLMDAYLLSRTEVKVENLLF